MKMNLIKILFILYSISIDCYGQNKPFLEVILNTNDTTLMKDEIFIRANEWFALNFNSANDVIQLKDKEAGKIVGKGFVEFEIFRLGNMSSGGLYGFSLFFECKDGRYKCSIFDVKHTGGNSGFRDGGNVLNDSPDCGNMNMWKSDWKKIRDNSIISMQSIVDDLRKYIDSENKSIDW